MKTTNRLCKPILLLTLATLLASCTANAPAPAPAAPDAPAATAAPAQAADTPQATEATQAEATPAETASSPEAAKTSEPAPAVMTYSESPMLTERVTAGKLPPVDERLPKQPLVVKPGSLIVEADLPNWTPGKYGGTLRSAHSVANWAPDIFMAQIENLLAAPGIGIVGLQPNLVQDYKVSDDNKTFTFYMREGLKWSDGQPVTTEDVQFTYEDYLSNEDLTPVFPQRFRDAGNPDGKPMKLEVDGPYVFRIIFNESYGGFLRELAIKGWQAYTDLVKPKHYLKAFHPKYTPMEQLKPLLDEKKLGDEWWTLFNQADCTNWEMTSPSCVGFPTLYPWASVKGSSSESLAWERNPYYFKVDTQGQQLPYIDKIISQQSENVEAVNLRLLAGDVDFLRESTSLVKVPLYKENEEKAGIGVHLMDMHVGPTVLFLNLTYSDTNWTQVVNDLRFRQAVNLALPRAEIIESIYFQYATPPTTVSGESNVEEAQKLLDEMGLDKKDAEGFRLGPDGKTFVIPIEHGAHAPDIAPAAELVAEGLKAVGLKTTLKQIDPSLWGQRNSAGDLQATVFWDVEPMWADNMWTDYLPGSTWANDWVLWYTTRGEKGQEPPAEIKQLYEIYEGRVKTVPNSPEDNQLAESIITNFQQNLWFLPLAEGVKYPLVASTKLSNIPEAGQAIAANASLEQIFFK